MAELYDLLRDNKQPLQGYISNDLPDAGEAVAVDVATPIISAYLGGKTFDFVKGIAPFMGEIWGGRNLLFGNNTKQIGREYYKKYINPNPVENDIMGKTTFPNRITGKINAEYVEQLPFLRYFTSINKNIKRVPNNKVREDANGFYNMKQNWKGKNYDYQYKINKYTNKPEFHNIKPYELFEEDLKQNNLYDLLKE